MKAIDELKKLADDTEKSIRLTRQELHDVIKNKTEEIEKYTAAYNDAVKNNQPEQAHDYYNAKANAEFELKFACDRMKSLTNVPTLDAQEYRDKMKKAHALVVSEDEKATRKAMELLDEFIKITTEMKERDFDFNNVSELLYVYTDRTAAIDKIVYEKNKIVTILGNLNGMNGCNFNVGAYADTKDWLKTRANK